MIVCPHCGWENPSEAAFCTNCGRGLAKARASRVAHDDAEHRTEGGRRGRVHDNAAKTARDHEMPLLRLFAESVAPPVGDLAVEDAAPLDDAPSADTPPLEDAEPLDEAGLDAESAVYELTTAELEAAAPAEPPPEFAAIAAPPVEPLVAPPPADEPSVPTPVVAAPPADEPPVAAPVVAAPPVAAASVAGLVDLGWPSAPEHPVESAAPMPRPESVAPMPRLRSPGPTRDATATLVDFRMPASFATDPAQAMARPMPPVSPPVVAVPPPLVAANLPPVSAEPELVEPEALDAEEFPGLEVEGVPPAVAAHVGTADPGEAPTIPRAVTPAPPSVAEILPLASLSPSSPLRVARIIEPIDEPTETTDDLDEDIEIPSSPQLEGVAELGDDPALFEADAPDARASTPPSTALAVDLGTLDDVDLDNRIEDVDEVEDISVSDVADLDGGNPDDEILRSSELEAVRPDVPRAAPPPLREMDVRFILRPLSQNLAESRLVTIGDGGLSIGRSDADLCLDADPYLSPRHLQFTVQHDTLFAEDLGTVNGTWIRVRSQIELKPGDTFRVGHQLFRLERVPPRSGDRELADGTRRFGTDRDASQLCLQQIGDDGQPRNCYHLTDQGARIGRHIADIVFTDDTFMSGTHAVVLPRDDRAVLRDLSSRNGTWVRVVGRQHVGAGDALMLGQTVWRISRPVT